jgi:hypothetical protein
MNAHTRDHCGFRCQFGIADERPMTVTFTAMGGSGQHINDMLAANGKEQ